MTQTQTALEQAACRIAKDRHPDQYVVRSWPFGGATWTEVQMSGGSVLIGRDEAESEVER